MRKTLSFMLVFLLVFSVFSFLSMPKVEAATDEWNAERYGNVMDINGYLEKLDSDPQFREKMDKQIKEMMSKINLNEQDAAVQTAGDDNFEHEYAQRYFLAYDHYNGIYFKTYTLRSLGDNVEVWIADDLAFEDGRPTPVITQEQADHMKDVFDETVYPTDTEFFGIPDSHTGTNNKVANPTYFDPNYYLPDYDDDGNPIEKKERVIILVDTIRDENYYDQEYPFIIGGFYWGTYEYYLDRNIINIRSTDWETRLDKDWLPTTAHEFQHLIHADNSPGEETWINEGMSDFAEYLCFGEHAWGHVNYFLDHPENSLVWWDEYYNVPEGYAGEVLADYGQAYLMQLYLYEQYGKEFVRQLAISPEIGIASLNNELDKDNTDTRDFNEIFRDFNTALVVDSKEPGDGRYNFETIDLQIDFEEAALYAKDGVPAWGCDFLEINKANKIYQMKMDGVPVLPAMPTPWMVTNNPLTETEQVLWSNEGHDKDNFLIFEADLTNTDTATLIFDHLVQIEEAWDYGFVQISTDQGETWTSLTNGNTTDIIDPQGAANIKANLPGFTGFNEEWSNEVFDLSEYAGQKVYIAFRYMTDEAFNEAGWFIKNISIPEIQLSYAGDSLDGFMSKTELAPSEVKYQIAFINEKSLGKGKNIPNYRVMQIDPYNVTEEQSIMLKEFFSGGNNYMIIWYTAEIGEKAPVPYSYEIITKSDAAKQKKK